MPTRWETFPIEFKGGLVTNLSRLQQGIKQPGSARELINFEPSIKGGYRRINGYTKYSSAHVPPCGDPKVQGSGQSGTSLVVSNVLSAPEAGMTLTISGVTGTYTISSSSFNATSKEATLTLSTSLASSPADKASVLFGNTTGTTEGVFYSKVGGGLVYAFRGGLIWSSNGGAWTKINTPSYGTVLVAGAGQTGTTLNVDGITSDTYSFRAGDTFSIAGVEKVYAVTSVGATTSGAVSLTISPALASSPADNAAITVLNNDLSSGTKARFVEYNFNGTYKFVFVDNYNYPMVWDGTSFKYLNDSTDLLGSERVAVFNDHLFFSKDDLVTFCAPFNEDDFSVANGAGNFRMPGDVSGMIVFRENLIVFTNNSIKALSGTSVSEFVLNTITLDIGCIQGDTIQEVGGDVIFLGPDGLRFLGATDRIGDFSLALASRNIQDRIIRVIDSGAPLASTVVREKNQYRIFEFISGRVETRAEGYIGVQFIDQDFQGFSWSKTEGLKVYRVSSNVYGSVEKIVFVGEDGFVYQMESGSTFDGSAINAKFYGPYLSVNDPTLRKTAYKISTFYDPEGTFEGILSLNYDFNDPDRVQPGSVAVSAGGVFSYFGSSVFGADNFGGNPETVITHQVTGSFNTVSLQYEFNGEDEPFTLDTVLLEYRTNDRK